MFNELLELLPYKEILCEVLVEGEWIEYDMMGAITPESKEWHKTLNRPLVIIAEGEYPVRFNKKEDGTRNLCFYQRTTTKT
jgi:glycerate-2-kinase